MRRALTILGLGLGVLLQGCYQPVFAQTSNYGGVSINGSYTTNCIPVAVTSVTLQCSTLIDDGVKVTGTLPFRLADGTASAPAYSFTGATTEGMTNLTNNGVGVMFNTTNWMSIQSSNFQLPSGVVLGWPNSTTIAAAANDTTVSRGAAGVVAVGTSSTPGNSAGTLNAATFKYRGLAQTYFVASDFTTSGVGTALENITGLTWTFPATTAMNVRVDCNILYAQNVANVAVAFGFQDATVAPTNLAASGIQYTSATASTEGTLAASTTTTATAVTSATPSAITTIWHAQLHFLIEQPSNASTSVFTIMTSTATAADTVTVKRGSYCSLAQ